MSGEPEFRPDPGWIPFHPKPSKPSFTPPPGAVDAHCHVFGPGTVFPYAPERRYTPEDAPKEKLWALRDFLGFERNVIVQATCHGADNRALADALRDARGRARGVATVRPDVTGAELAELNAAGVRGVRFNFVKRLAERPADGEVREIVRRIEPLGWHVVVYFEAQDLDPLRDLLETLPVPVVIDHMGRPDVTKPADGEEFSRFLALLRERKNVWSKVSGSERLSRAGPAAGYEDVVPFSRRVVESFPDRVLWGTDWPHPNMTTHAPDDGQLVDVIPRVAGSAELQRKLLVDNPMRLYWPEEMR